MIYKIPFFTMNSENVASITSGEDGWIWKNFVPSDTNWKKSPFGLLLLFYKNGKPQNSAFISPDLERNYKAKLSFVFC